MQNGASSQGENKKNPIKQIFVDSCIAYTFFVFTLSLIVSIVNGSMTIFVTDFVWLYAFALLIGCANMILRYKPLSLFVRVILHVITIFSGFALYLVLVKQNDASSVAFLSIPFIAAYAVIMIGVLVVTKEIQYNNF